MPSYLDLGLIVVVLVSALLSMLRGFTREILAIASWAAAAGAAYYFYPLALPYIKPYIQKDTIALAVSAACVFFITLVLVSLITVKISDVILDSKIGALDRTLGFVFGSARGLILCVVAFMFFNWLVPEKGQPQWVTNARMRPILTAMGDQLKSLLPDDPENTI
ncbi:MAG: CvpA family protein [Alphaproteobacteria bacterium]|nr:CvpA family protein [Alphaproteobacteria bacterium]